MTSTLPMHSNVYSTPHSVFSIRTCSMLRMLNVQTIREFNNKISRQGLGCYGISQRVMATTLVPCALFLQLVEHNLSIILHFYISSIHNSHVSAVFSLVCCIRISHEHMNVTCWIGLSKSLGFRHSSQPHCLAISNLLGLVSMP